MTSSVAPPWTHCRFLGICLYITETQLLWTCMGFRVEDLGLPPFAMPVTLYTLSVPVSILASVNKRLGLCPKAHARRSSEFPLDNLWEVLSNCHDLLSTSVLPGRQDMT